MKEQYFLQSLLDEFHKASLSKTEEVEESSLLICFYLIGNKYEAVPTVGQVIAGEQSL